MKSFIFGLLGAVMLAAGALAQQSDPALDKLIADYQTGWAKADAKGLAALYTDNALRLADGQLVRGRQEIQAMFEKNFAGPWKGTKVTIASGRTEALGADVRLVEGTFEVSGPTGPPQRGRFLNTFVRQGGQWKIAGLSAMTQTPAPTK